MILYPLTAAEHRLLNRALWAMRIVAVGVLVGIGVISIAYELR